MLGAGAFGKVFHTQNKHDASFEVAIKVLDKVKLADSINSIMNEVAILNALDHPNIVKYYETYNDEKFIYLVMEYISGKPLFEKIIEQPSNMFSEDQAAQYMRQLFQAINHCHAQEIVHRDIKPDNIMINANNTVRLIDFGLSKESINQQRLKTIAGTPYYMAPEVINGSHGKKADLWSLGVVLYTMVSGYLPFQGQIFEVFRKIREGDFHFDHPEFRMISEECKDLIRNLLKVEYSERFDG